MEPGRARLSRSILILPYYSRELAKPETVFRSLSSSAVNHWQHMPATLQVGRMIQSIDWLPATLRC